MGKLVYGMLQSLDGYVRDADGDFGWAEPGAEAHALINEQARSIGTYLLGRRMYETLVYWETAHLQPDQPPHIVEYARLWQAAEKIVYSTTLDEVASARTRVERSFEPSAVRTLVERSPLDVSISGPTLAAQAVRAGLVDEYHSTVVPAIVGGGMPFHPAGVRVGLELIGTRRCRDGEVFLRHAVTDAGRDPAR